MSVSKGAFLYEGKAKRIYETGDPSALWVEFKDDATAFNGQKKGQILDKGRMNARISAALFARLEAAGIPTHFREQVGERDLLVDRLRMLPLEVVVRNRVAGSLAARTGLAEGTPLPRPVVELYYKNDELGDPLLNEDHVLALGLADEAAIADLKTRGRAVNDFLSAYFDRRGIILVDFKLEFGTFTAPDGSQVLKLGDEISPDTCRLWDKRDLTKLDKDRFRRDLGGVEEAYREVLERVLQ
ncbi:phosphoribosylaminoimidazole succinocarboxamide synthetase [Candidatus Hydrogenisulfobacillus filiaventi]|uniref:Phosphoribosylaminoimidazole-succinocarboxamide synthase n=1 Tax=Candidatus Hydrogenisulfobacillus filiaventi TaxID=2707344 RepID=A0A6F8ZII7_9FIRM|nr:phosphoribosylaminoimidazolesuccinocarboxamide synthase [Bacillota bacterium]CAB1129261.1 phosphoribosylaminoimidazole succinocarboxamide synthetase [Candidatus Hydrogenisulfobacillus filiaventi]